MVTSQARPQGGLSRLSEIAQVAARHGFGYFLRRNRLDDLAPGGTDGAIAAGSAFLMCPTPISEAVASSTVLSPAGWPP